MEKAYFADSSLLDEIDAAEVDLIDRYVHGLLSAAERSRFESHYLGSDVSRLHRVEFARALAAISGQQLTAAAPAWSERLMAFFMPLRPVFAALILCAVIASVWWAGRTRQTERTQLPAAIERTEPVKPPGSSAGSEPPRSEPTLMARAEPKIFDVRLQPDAVRSGSGREPVRIPPERKRVRLRLVLDSRPEGRLSGVVESIDGKEVYRTTVVAVRSAEARFDLPSRVLSPGEYLVRLLSPDQEPFAEYLLTIR